MLLELTYLKFDLSEYKVSCKSCWLPSSSLYSVLYLNLIIMLSVRRAFSLSINVHAQKHWNSKIFVKKVLRKL